MRFELWILLQELAVTRLERGKVLLLLVRQLLEHAPAAAVGRRTCRARIEFESAPLCGDCDPQRVTREEKLRRAPFAGGRTSRAARFAGAVDLQHALPRGEVPRRRN